MRHNKIRELLKAGQPTLSTHIHSSWPSVVEVVGHTGAFDYVEFVSEYAPFDLNSLEHFCRAVELFDMSCMIKVDQAPRSWLAQRAIGAGFQGVLFADVRTVEDARECIRVCRADTPRDQGSFGATSRRFQYMLDGGTEAYVQALRDVVVALMIEKKSAVDHLEEILSLGGIDMVQWGPSDYSVSIGKPGRRTDPEIKATERKVIEAALRRGVAPRAEVVKPEDAQYYLDLGVRHFNLNVDLWILLQWWTDNGKALREKLPK